MVGVLDGRLSHSASRDEGAIKAWRRVTGDYEYRENPPVDGYPNIRAVEWTRQFSRDDLPKRILYD